jgi:hypothetical protein
MKWLISQQQIRTDTYFLLSVHTLRSNMSEFNQMKQHAAVKTFAPPSIKGETFLQLTVTECRCTTSLLSPISPAWGANSKTHHPNTFKMEPSMSSHGMQKNWISVSVKCSSWGVALWRTLCFSMCHMRKSYWTQTQKFTIILGRYFKISLKYCYNL